MADDSDIWRVERNVQRMLDQQAPESDVDAYLKSEGMTPAQFKTARTAAKASPSSPVLRYVDNLIRSVASGATFGASDEFAAAADAATQPVLGRGSDAGTFSERYGKNINTERARDRQFRADNPIASTVANVGGSLLSTLALGRAVPSLVPWMGGGGGPMLARMARGGVGGATIGGAAGFASGEGGLDERLQSAGEGAKLGGAIGVAAPPVMSALGAGARVVAETTPGRWVADQAAGVARGFGKVADKLTPRAPAQSGSAAAPEGGQPIPQDSLPARVSEVARSSADDISGQSVARRGAVERLVRRLERDQITPQQFADEMGRLGEDAAPFLAGGPNVRMLAKTTARLPGKGMGVAEEGAKTEARSIGPRMMGEVERSVAPDTKFFTAFEKQAQQRADDAKKAYRAAMDDGLKVSGDMAYIEKTVPAVQQARARLEAEAQRLGIKLDPTDLADKIKQTLNAEAAAQYGPGFHPAKKMIADAADRWEDALWKANPKLKAASDMYAANSRVMGALDEGRKFLIGGTGEQGTRNAADAIAAQFKTMSTQEQEAFRVGVASAIREKLMAGPDAARAFAKQLDQSGLLREKLVEIVGPVNAERIFNMAGKEMKRAQGWRGVTGGSDTMWNAAAVADEGLPTALNPARGGGPWSRMWDYAFDRFSQGMRGNEAVRGELAQILFSSNPTDRARLIEEIERHATMRANRRLPGAVTAGGASQVGRQER